MRKKIIPKWLEKRTKEIIMEIFVSDNKQSSLNKEIKKILKLNVFFLPKYERFGTVSFRTWILQLLFISEYFTPFLFLEFTVSGQILVLPVERNDPRNFRRKFKHSSCGAMDSLWTFWLEKFVCLRIFGKKRYGLKFLGSRSLKRKTLHWFRKIVYKILN